jgi:hypothetical protein
LPQSFLYSVYGLPLQSFLIRQSFLFFTTLHCLSLCLWFTSTALPVFSFSELLPQSLSVVDLQSFLILCTSPPVFSFLYSFLPQSLSLVHFFSFLRSILPQPLSVVDLSTLLHPASVSVCGSPLESFRFFSLLMVYFTPYCLSLCLWLASSVFSFLQSIDGLLYSILPHSASACGSPLESFLFFALHCPVIFILLYTASASACGSPLESFLFFALHCCRLFRLHSLSFLHSILLSLCLSPLQFFPFSPVLTVQALSFF